MDCGVGKSCNFNTGRRRLARKETKLRMKQDLNDMLEDEAGIVGIDLAS
jgi:hypothetical protein